MTKLNRNTSYEQLNALRIRLLVRDCQLEKPIWQTVLVAILASLCVVLLSTVAILFILYQQQVSMNASKGSRQSNDDGTGDDYDDDARQQPPVHRSNSDETFINPRRTSSYDFNTLTKASTSGLDMRNIPEEDEPHAH